MPLVDFVAEPVGRQYKDIVSCASMLANTALLVIRPELGLSGSGQQILDKLEPFLITCESRQKWPGTVLLFEHAEVRTYRMSPEVVSIIASSVTSLYG